MNKPIVSAIAAIGKNRELGKDGKIPWRIPEDVRFFKEKTTGHPVIMGRKTYESIGKPLPNRTNIIITRNPDYALQASSGRPEYTADGCVIVSSITEAIEKASEHDEDEIFIIGGAEVYKLAMPYTNKLYLTLIEGTFEADAFFPDYPEFKLTKRSEPLSSGSHRYTFEEYVRIT